MKPETIGAIFMLLSILGCAVIVTRILRSIWRWTFRR